jgi:glycosyltransferase involved in cell wall biosynthesis
MIKITHFNACDLKSVSEGGISSYLRGLIKHSTKITEYRLVGVTKDNEYRVGSWTKCKLNTVYYSFLPILSVTNDHITYKGGIPLSIKYIMCLFRYRNIISKTSDILHFHRLEFIFPFVWFYKKEKRPLIFVTVHGFPKHVEKYKKHSLLKIALIRKLYFLVERYVLLFVDRIIFVSVEAKDYYCKKFPYLINKSEYLPTFVDLDDFKPMDKYACRKKFSLDEEKKIVLYIGRFDGLKGLDLLLNAHKLLENESADEYLLLLAGEGEEKARLQELAKRLEIRKIKFIGALPHSEIAEMINCADVFALASKSEGMPIALLEALACGIPAISTNVGQISDIVKNGYNGFLIEGRDPQVFKQKIAELIETGESLKKNCIESVRQYSSSIVSEKLVALYSKMTENKRCPL